MELHKTCKGCGQSLPVERFPITGPPRKDGTRNRRRSCYTCLSDYYARLKREHWQRHLSQNRTRQRAKEARRRLLKRTTEVERVDYEAILHRDGYSCHICQCHVPLDEVEYDHVVPLSKGGTHTYENIKVAHSYCNAVKFDRSLRKTQSDMKVGPYAGIA